MTQEEKAKAYDEAIIKAKALYGQPFVDNTLLETIIPELKESDDERIRKGLVEMVHDTTGDELWIDYNIHKEDALAWLEKQSETFTKKDIDDAYIEGMAFAKHELEKRGEQKPADKVVSFDGFEDLTDFEKALASICIGWIGEELGWKQYIKDNADALLKIAVEKFNSVQDVPFELEFTNKVEPKFKVGDWIVNKGHSYLIADIDYLEHRYLFEIGGYTHEQLNWEHIEIADKRYHPWTIQDAKDGDILVGGDWIFILKQFNSSGNNHKCYCHYDLTLDCFKDDTNSYMASGSNDFKPATKEQRDLLFAKMHEAGYMWDDKKKELKLLITNGGDFFESENCEQNPAWDEEDEHTLQGVIDEIQANKNQAPDYEFETYDRFLFWLKTLKHRIGG